MWLAKEEEVWLGGRRGLGLVACVRGDKAAAEGEEGVWLERGCAVRVGVTVWTLLPGRDCSRLQESHITKADC